MTGQPKSWMRRAWPWLYLAVAAVLCAMAALGAFRSMSTLPWIAGPLLGIGGAVAVVRRRGDGRAVLLLAVGIVLALAAPAAQIVGSRVESARHAREAMAALGGRPAPALAAEHRLNGAAELPEVPRGITVLNFWATWCPPCIEEMPMLQEFWREHGGDRLRVVGATALYRGTEEEVLPRIEETLAERGVTYPNLVSADGDLQHAYRAYTLPTTVLLDDGEVVEYAIGIRGTERVLEEAERRARSSSWRRPTRPASGSPRAPRRAGSEEHDPSPGREKGLR